MPDRFNQSSLFDGDVYNNSSLLFSNDLRFDLLDTVADKALNLSFLQMALYKARLSISLSPMTMMMMNKYNNKCWEIIYIYSSTHIFNRYKVRIEQSILFPKKELFHLREHYGGGIIALKSGKVCKVWKIGEAWRGGDYKVSGNWGGGGGRKGRRDKKGMSTCNRRAIY